MRSSISGQLRIGRPTALSLAGKIDTRYEGRHRYAE
jgi:hypothetical protein